MEYPSNIITKHISSDYLFNTLGVQMYHYSYTFPDQVYKKTAYYRTFVKGGTIENYFVNVYLAWVTGDSETRQRIENIYQGVHEWIPQRRGPCFTQRFRLEHPESIQNSMLELQEKFNRQLLNYFKK
jgi:hypothetical protein